MNLYLTDGIPTRQEYPVETLLKYRTFLEEHITMYEFKYVPDLLIKRQAELARCNKHIEYSAGMFEDFIRDITIEIRDMESLLRIPVRSYEGWWNQITMKGHYLSHGEPNDR